MVGGRKECPAAGRPSMLNPACARLAREQPAARARHPMCRRSWTTARRERVHRHQLVSQTPFCFR
jgi:hypothetical protein